MAMRLLTPAPRIAAEFTSCPRMNSGGGGITASPHTSFIYLGGTMNHCTSGNASAFALSCGVPKFGTGKIYLLGFRRAGKSFWHSECHAHRQWNARSGLAKAAFSDSAASPRKLEVVHNHQGRHEELAGELNNSGSISDLTLFSPSKINVFLRVTGQRPDGYHDLASLFHVISLGDILKFSISPSKSKDSLTTNVSGVPLDDKNLVIKALNLYRKKTGSSNYFWIHLDKRVPTGAGLGGGSGNAATALWAANQLNGGIVSEKDLQEWSGEIGSDIPFFFSHGAAYCTGRGEIVQDIPMPMLLDTPMVLMKPKEECSTAEVYKRFRLESTSSVDPEKLLSEIAKNGISQNVCINDLEPPAFEVLPSLKTLKQRILAARGHYEAVFMSGSGSTIVGVGDCKPPQFLYDENQYKNVFVSEAFFLTRTENEWYKEPEGRN